MANTERLALEAHPAETIRLAEWVAEVTVTLGLPVDVAFRLDVCLTEAIGNIIAYAFDDPLGHCVSVRADLDDHGLVVAVEDDGPPFDPLQVAAPVLSTRLEDAPIGGLGIYLIRTMADEVGYERQNGRNRLLMAFRDRPARH